MTIKEYYGDILKNKSVIIEPQKSWKFIKSKNLGRENLIAFSEEDKKVTYDEMYYMWDEFARLLSSLDICRENNSRILTIMPNLTMTGIVNYGSDITGAICDYIDPTSTYEKIREYIRSEKITDIIGLDLLLAKNIGSKIEELKKEHSIRNIISYKDKYMISLMPTRLKILSNMLHTMNKFSKDIIRYNDALKNTRYTRIKYDSLNGEQIDFITHTSGTTTGLGKPIPLSDHNRNSLVNSYELINFGWSEGMKILHFIPYFAGYGTVNTVHLGLCEGCELQQIPLFSPNQFGHFLMKFKSNVIIATTPCWLNLVNNPLYKNVDLSFLEIASTGGSPTTIEEEIKINDFLKAHGAKCKLIIGYGMSELAGCAITNINNFNELGSIGVPLPGVDVKFRDTSTKTIVNYNDTLTEGEALIHSETMSSGKLDGKEIIDIIEIEGKKYVITKDIMRSDEFGNIYYVGRTDGMFQRYDGYNVYPLNIETIIKLYSEIKDCALLWEDSQQLNGKIPKIFIELKESIDIPNKTDFIRQIIDNSFLSNKNNFKYSANFRDIPHVWVFVKHMPKNTMEKTDLHKLMSEEILGEVYRLEVKEDNMSLKSYEVIKEKQLTKKLIK